LGDSSISLRRLEDAFESAHGTELLSSFRQQQRRLGIEGALVLRASACTIACTGPAASSAERVKAAVRSLVRVPLRPGVEPCLSVLMTSVTA